MSFGIGPNFTPLARAAFRPSADGKEAIARCREEKPETYIKLIVSLIPRDVNLSKNRFDDLSEDELRDRIRQLNAMLRSELPDVFGDPVEDDNAPRSAEPLN